MSGNQKPITFGDLPPSRYPGERLKLPEHGPRSIARVGRRFAALGIDWAMALVLGLAFGLGWGTPWTILIFAVLQIVAIPMIAGSIGHRLVGIYCVKLGTGYIGWWRPLVRSLLLSVALPALVWDSDQRGFHDKIAGTVLIRSGSVEA